METCDNRIAEFALINVQTSESIWFFNDGDIESKGASEMGNIIPNISKYYGVRDGFSNCLFGRIKRLVERVGSKDFSNKTMIFTIKNSSEYFEMYKDMANLLGIGISTNHTENNYIAAFVIDKPNSIDSINCHRYNHISISSHITGDNSQHILNLSKDLYNLTKTTGYPIISRLTECVRRRIDPEEKSLLYKIGTNIGLWSDIKF